MTDFGQTRRDKLGEAGSAFCVAAKGDHDIWTTEANAVVPVRVIVPPHGNGFRRMRAAQGVLRFAACKIDHVAARAALRVECTVILSYHPIAIWRASRELGKSREASLHSPKRSVSLRIFIALFVGAARAGLRRGASRLWPVGISIVSMLASVTFNTMFGCII